MSRYAAAGAIIVVALGVVLRLLGFFSLELWSDEAGWCKRMIDGDYGWIRPIGYMWITKQLLALHVNEQVLRSLSYVAGLVQLPLVWFALRRIVERPWLAVAGTALIAIHPVAVAMTKEFKPYAMESMLHTLVVVLALSYVASGRTRPLAGFLTVAVIAPLFAWTIAFAYPAAFLVVGMDALRKRRIAHGVAIVGGCVATLGVLAALFAARLASKKPDAGFWGKKYDVFFLGDNVVDRLAWTLEKTLEIAMFPAHLELVWPAAALLTVVKISCAALCIAGAVGLLARRRFVVAALACSPWLVTFAFNLAGVWPYGLFRTNVFLLFYSLVLAIAGLDAIAHLARVAPFDTATRTRLTRACTVSAVVLALVVFPFDPRAFRHKAAGTLTAEASVNRALARIYEAETGLVFGAAVDDATARDREVRAAASRAARPRERAPYDGTAGLPGAEQALLVMDGHACSIMRYYRDYDADSRVTLHDWLPAHFVTRCSTFGAARWHRLMDSVKGRSFWLVSAKRGFPERTRKALAGACDLQTPAVVNEVMPESTLLYRCRATPEAAAAAAAVAVDADSAAPRAGDDEPMGTEDEAAAVDADNSATAP